ncbi:hypothetical protein [Mucilaginibacter paludis]|nr:hypothetical protein [Mucilaginibacter paludis]
MPKAQTMVYGLSTMDYIAPQFKFLATIAYPESQNHGLWSIDHGL